MTKCFKHLKPDTRKPGAFSHRVMPEHVVAWQLNVRMRLFQPGLAFKAENPSDRIMGRDLIDSAAESRFILTHHLPAQHLEHLGSGPLDDGHSGQQS